MVFAPVFLCLFSPEFWVPARVLDHARSCLGQKIGAGECGDLVGEALRQAGISGGDYGRELDSITQARPGDILQFEDAEFEGRTKRGRSVRTHWHRFPEHVAIVSVVGPPFNGRPVVTVVHQNYRAPGDDEESAQRVTELRLRLADLKSGTIRVFRPGGH